MRRLRVVASSGQQVLLGAAVSDAPNVGSVEGSVALERRIRVLDSETSTDARGKHFVRFAIDLRSPYHEEGEWQVDWVQGCAYPEDARVFVKRDDDYVPASSLLGKDVEPEPVVCRAAVVGA